MDFCHLREIYPTNMDKNCQILLKNRTRRSKNHIPKKAVHKTAEVKRESIRNKYAKKT